MWISIAIVVLTTSAVNQRGIAGCESRIGVMHPAQAEHGEGRIQVGSQFTHMNCPMMMSLAYTPLIRRILQTTMRRLQIYLEEELDEALALRARRQGTSKAALIRKYVATQIEPATIGADPLDKFVGKYDDEPGPIDDVVYGAVAASTSRRKERRTRRRR
jgi:hypothetical protein